MHHRVAATNHSDGVTTSEISFAFDADFADVLEVQARGRGFARSNRGAKTSNLIGNEQVVFSYTGLDNVVRKTVLIFDPPPTRLTESSALYRLILEPRKVLTLFATIYCDPQGIPKPVSFFKSFALVQND